MNIVYFDDSDGRHRIDRLAEELKVKREFKYSDELAKEADIVWIDFFTGNLFLASQGNFKGKLVVRASAMELYRKMTRTNWDRVDMFVFISEHLRDFFISKNKEVKLEKTKVIPLGIDLNKFTLKTNLEKNTNIAVVSEIHWRKGVHQIPRVLASLPKEYEIHHIGKVTDWDCKNYLDWEIKRLGLENRYHFKEFRSDVDGFLEDKTYLLHCSYTEGCPRAVGEAMSKGIIPLVNLYRGAEKQWPKEFIWEKPEQLISIMIKPTKPEDMRTYIQENYNIRKVAEIVKKELELLNDK